MKMERRGYILGMSDPRFADPEFYANVRLGFKTNCLGARQNGSFVGVSNEDLNKWRSR